jgi:hypothetical protein
MGTSAPNSTPVMVGSTQCRRHHDECGDHEPFRVHMGGIEQGDDGDPADVVCHREGEQEDARAQRNATAEQSEHAHREGNIGSHGYAPPVARLGRKGDQEVDQTRHDHAACGSQNRQSRSPRIAKLSCHDLLLDADGDDEEEPRHGDVVDEGAHGAVPQGHITDTDGRGRRPHHQVALAERPVRPDEGDYRCSERGDARSRLPREDALDRPDEAARDEALRLDPGVRKDGRFPVRPSFFTDSHEWPLCAVSCLRS